MNGEINGCADTRGGDNGEINCCANTWGGDNGVLNGFADTGGGDNGALNCADTGGGDNGALNCCVDTTGGGDNGALNCCADTGDGEDVDVWGGKSFFLRRLTSSFSSRNSFLETQLKYKKISQVTSLITLQSITKNKTCGLFTLIIHTYDYI